MGHVSQELERLGRALLDERNGARCAELYAAQQALAWCLDPYGLNAPCRMIMGTQEGSEDYP